MTNKIQKFLVTGGAGFIGSAVVRHIINETNHLVINVDKLTYAGDLRAVSEVSSSPRYIFERVDICDAVEINRVFREHKPDIVMHLAAETHVDRSIDTPDNFIQANIIGTYTLLEAAKAYWYQLENRVKTNFRFHHISTDEVYGDLPHPDEVYGELPRFTENFAYAPSSPYSASKASSDHLVRAWSRTFGLPTMITNCSNNYGPHQVPEKLIPLMILNALQGKSLPIYGNGNQIRDWLHVDDHARALLLVATEGICGETYNIGGNNEIRNIDVVKQICNILEELYPSNTNPLIRNSKFATRNYESLITFVKDRPGHDFRYAIDAGKIQKQLGWTPNETFYTGLRKTIKWYVDNDNTALTITK